MLHFLLVETDAGQAEILKLELEQAWVAAVSSASCGSVASHLLSAHRFDLAVIESVLPNISGFELARQAANGNVPVLLTSKTPEQQEFCRAYGFPFLAKPLTPTALFAAMTATLHRTPQNIARVQQSCAGVATSVLRSKLIAQEAARLRTREHSLGG